MNANGMGMWLAALAVAGTAGAAEPLVVEKGSPLVEAEGLVEYSAITLHDDYTIGEGVTVTNRGQVLDIGPGDGDYATLTVTDGGQFVGDGVGQASATREIVIGRNGGSGKISVGDLETPVDTKRNKSGWNYNNYTFGAMEWKLKLAANALTGVDDGDEDILEIGPNAFFSIGQIVNENTRVRAHVRFAGGTYYQHHRCSILSSPVVGSEIIFEGVDGNDINIMRMDGTMYNLAGYSGKSGLLRFRGMCNVIFNGTGDKTGNMRPGIRLSDCCKFEQTGDIIVKNYLELRLDGSVTLPFGPNTGDMILQDPGTLFDLSGYSVNLNGLQGTGSITNASTKNIAFVTVTNEFERLSSELLSPGLVWLDSEKGVRCRKRGAGDVLADSFPAAPWLTIEAGTVRTTSAATAATMKGRHVEFKNGSALAVENGLFTAEETVFHPLVPVSVSAGAAYRANGDSSLVAPTVAVGSAIEKTGAGTLTVYDGATAFPGIVRAMGGTVRFSPRGDTNDFWRLTIMEGSGVATASSRYINQLADIVLYDANRVQIGKNGMSLAELGIEATALQPGQFTLPAGIEYTLNSTSMTSLNQLFDGARWSSASFKNVFPEYDDPSSWFPITMRLKANHNPVESFRMIVGWAGNNSNPQRWRLESSPDGVNWETRAERLDTLVETYDANGYFQDDYVTGFARGGSLGLAATAVLRADAGGTIDLSTVPEGSAPCAGLEFDYAQGGGTISRFEPADSGVLTIVNFPEGKKLAGYKLPLTFGSMVGAMNLATWRVVVNGEEVPNTLVWEDGSLSFKIKGLSLIVR